MHAKKEKVIHYENLTVQKLLISSVAVSDVVININVLLSPMWKVL